MKTCLALVLGIFIVGCFADVYMHNPRGSNDRNCEKDVNRKNANRLFDSQNNAAGGYACPFPENNKMWYASGSKLKLEWTAQHGCGNGRVRCDIVIQYTCGGGIRDGNPTDKNKEGTDRIPEEQQAVTNQAFGMHENLDYYQTCKARQRNKGLWIADRNVGDQRGATRTRQNNNGDRHGFECPEERDYYPYWAPTPWRDIAVFTDDVGRRCPHLQSESQNVKDKGWCKWVSGTKPNDAKMEGKWPNNQADCVALKQQWVVDSKWNLPAPECLPHPVSRENHLGNIIQQSSTQTANLPELFSYWWTIPEVSNEQTCVVRIRYNITGNDIPTHTPGNFIDAKSNGKDKSPIVQDPYIQYNDRLISLKINSNQYGRTFQDRSYTFRIVPKSQARCDGTVYNLNTRGKRGNIVQTYPSVEYDFVPNNLKIEQNDCLHIQWVGSNFNPQRGPNDAEGGPHDGNPNQNARADRHNLVEIASGSMLIPMNDTQLQRNTMFVQQNGQPNMNLIQQLSFLGQTNCLSLDELVKTKNKRATERDPRNCAKINTQSPYFNAGVVQMRKAGTFNYMCTRNNNFSNRNQVGVVQVGTAKRIQPGTQGSDDEGIPASNPDNIVKRPVDEDEDLPAVRDSAEQDERNNAAQPDQYKDNDSIGKGVSAWMADVKQAFKLISQDAATDVDTTTTTTTSSSSDGLSNGAIAGIAIGCAIGGLIIGAVIGLFVFKSSSGGNMQPLHS